MHIRDHTRLSIHTCSDLLNKLLGELDLPVSTPRFFGMGRLYRVLHRQLQLAQPEGIGPCLAMPGLLYDAHVGDFLKGPGHALEQLPATALDQRPRSVQHVPIR